MPAKSGRQHAATTDSVPAICRHLSLHLQGTGMFAATWDLNLGTVCGGSADRAGGGGLQWVAVYSVAPVGCGLFCRE